VSVSQTLRRWTEDATYVRQGDHHVGHWPTFLVLSEFTWEMLANKVFCISVACCLWKLCNILAAEAHMFRGWICSVSGQWKRRAILSGLFFCTCHLSSFNQVVLYASVVYAIGMWSVCLHVLQTRELYLNEWILVIFWIGRLQQKLEYVCTFIFCITELALFLYVSTYWKVCIHYFVFALE